jgi:hypothetical protein
MPKRKEKIVTSRKGINYLRTIVEDTGSIFNEIHQENDVGIDVIVELFDEEKPINKLVAFQVKSGTSFYDKKNDMCLIPVDDHYDYWIKYSIPVYGFVFIPPIKLGYWINIKEYFKRNEKVNVIKFQPNTLNTLSEEYFVKVFFPMVSNELPNITFDLAFKLLYSSHYDEVAIGLTVLFKRFANENKTWDCLIDFFRKTEIDAIPPVITYYFAHIPWHSDIFYANESYTDESKFYAKNKILDFTREDIIKLISFIDDENVIARGTPGQNVKAIVSIINYKVDKLYKIIEDKGLDLHTRAIAAILYAYNKGERINEVKKIFKKDEPWFVHVMIDAIQEDPEFMPL